MPDECSQGLRTSGSMGRQTQEGLPRSGISLTGKVSSYPRGKNFLFSQEGFGVGVREILGKFKGVTHAEVQQRTYGCCTWGSHM